MTVETPENVSSSEPVVVAPELTQTNTTPDTAKNTPEVPKLGPAQDLRNIQTLLVMGQFPGQAAPEVCKAYQLLEAMAKKIEEGAK
jgi:hypothetical protein